ncbi:MAG: hypothetical protein ACR2P0_15805 [Acidimicrobiales bacterium]
MTRGGDAESAYVWRGQFVVGRDLPDLGELGLEKRRIASYDLWTSAELPVVDSGVVTIIGQAATLSGKTLTEHFSTISFESDVHTVAELGLDLVGRFVLLAALREGVAVFPDVMASRRVFLSEEGAIASSSEVLLQRLGASARPIPDVARGLLDNPKVIARQYATYGIHSPVTGYRRLLPNRVANLATGVTSLCSPTTERRRVSVPDVSRTLRAVASALGRLGDLEIGLTSGFDSRFILAALAAEGVDANTFTYVDGGAMRQFDADIARKVADALGFRHEEIPHPEPDDDIIDLLRASQAIVRPVPHMISQLTALRRRQGRRITVSGAGGEIARTRYATLPNWLGPSVLRRILLGHDPAPHDSMGFDEWWDDRFGETGPDTWLEVESLHYWEQRVPIWGAQYVAEKDLFGAEVSGFACGRLQQELISFPLYRRAAAFNCRLYSEIIEEVSPRTAQLPPVRHPPLVERLHDLTPLLRLVRTLRPGWDSHS